MTALATAALAAACSAPASSRVGGAPAPVQDTAEVSTSSPGPSVTPAARSLVLPQTVRAEIVSAWTAAQGLEPRDVAGLRPGAYYGYVPATRTFWALVDFAPSDPTPPKKVAAKIEAGPWVLSRQQGQRWHLVGDTGGLVCPTAVPAVMLAAWALATDVC